MTLYYAMELYRRLYPNTDSRRALKASFEKALEAYKKESNSENYREICRLGEQMLADENEYEEYYNRIHYPTH